jgi:alpha-tubulin suppressor-like RCC1 family protein
VIGRGLFIATACLTVSAGTVAAGRSQVQALRPRVTAAHHDLSHAADAAPTFTQISLGGDFACGLTAKGTVLCWGASIGADNVPSGAFRQISTSQDEGCGVSTGGSISCWGAERGALSRTGSFKSVSLNGDDFSELACGLKTSGSIECWGDGGSLGTAPAGPFTQMSLGGGYACALRSSGAIACWGTTQYGLNKPPSGDFTQVSAGTDAACGLKASGVVICWGDDSLHQTDVPAGMFKQVSAGGSFACGVETQGSVACWGYDQDGNTEPPSGTFAYVSTNTSSNPSVCGLNADGAVVCWGDNTYGEFDAPSGTFTEVSTGGSTPDGGDAFACGLKSSGSATCWGADNYGDADAPTADFSQIASGGEFACGLMEGGYAACWGNNDYGQTDVPSGSFSQVAAGTDTACALTSVGQVTCWGNPANGGSSPPSRSFSEVTVGDHFACGVIVGSSISCWGKNSHGQANAPVGSFTSVRAGSDFACALKIGGGVVCWGNNDQGQASPPSGKFTQLTSGYDHACGLTTSGSVVCWGEDLSGQTDPPSGSRFSQVAAGGAVTCGVGSGGVRCWGSLDMTLRSFASASTCQPVLVAGTDPRTVFLLASGVNSQLNWNYNGKGHGGTGAPRKDFEYQPLQGTTCPDDAKNPLNGDEPPSVTKSPGPGIGLVYAFHSDWPWGNTNLVQAIAQDGGVALPFSYVSGGMTVSGTGTAAVVHIKGYGPWDVGGTPPSPVDGVKQSDSGAYRMNQVLQQIHTAWPSTQIVVIGHSEGGFVAEQWWERYGTGNKLGVTNVFSLDSPINGFAVDVCKVGLPVVGNLCGPLHIQGPLDQLWDQRWQNRLTDDRQIATKDSASANHAYYIAIGTEADGVYILGDDASYVDRAFHYYWNPLLSQMVFTDSCSTNTKSHGNDCAIHTPNILSVCETVPSSWEPDAVIGSHEQVLGCATTQEVVASILSG